MNESKHDKYRYWVTFLLEDLPIGAYFMPGVLHLTFLNWFVTDREEEALIASFYETFSGRPAFDARIGKDAHLGPKEDVSVALVEPIPHILELHAEALNWFKELEGRWAVKHPYFGDEFIPHIRRRPPMELTEGEKLNIHSLTLVRALRRADDNRFVAAKVFFS